MSDAATSYATALADVAIGNNTLDLTYSEVYKLGKLLGDETGAELLHQPYRRRGGENQARGRDREVVGSAAARFELREHPNQHEAHRSDRRDLQGIRGGVQQADGDGACRGDVGGVIGTAESVAKGVPRLTGAKNVRIKTVLDPSLVAGFTIRYGDSGSKFLGMSVKKQLEEIAAQLDIGDVQLAVR